ncbi:MAG: hypothetical protein VKN56_08585 [Cyanobacteriota bacterium]|nr:hypothetical protein [Cyanobacteriota bacterium]
MNSLFELKSTFDSNPNHTRRWDSLTLGEKIDYWEFISFGVSVTPIFKAEDGTDVLAWAIEAAK